MNWLISFLRTFSLQSRLIGAFLLIALALGALLPVTLFTLNDLGQQYTTLASQQPEIDMHLATAAERLQMARLGLLAYTSGAAATNFDAIDSLERVDASIKQAADLFAADAATVGAGGEGAGLSPAPSSADFADLRRGLDSLLRSAREQAPNLSAPIVPLDADIQQLSDELNALRRARQVQREQLLQSYQQRLMIRQIGFGAALAALAIGAILVVIPLTLSITRPINDLRSVAEGLRSEQTGAQPVTAPVTGRDELTTLATSLNQLSGQLSQSYAALEQRVTDRTQALEQRALQMQTAAEIAREAAAIPDLTTLLNRSVNLIRDRFDLYHVALFLLDDERQFAIMRAGTGEAGASLLNKNFRLRLSQVGIVPAAINSGEARIVNDVEADFAYLRDAQLPNTRSEAAIPLKVGRLTTTGQPGAAPTVTSTVIGVLDVQHIRMGAFDSELVVALKIMADQLAVAIQNARLVSDLQSSLEEIRSLYQRYTQQTWAGSVRRGGFGYQYDLLEVTPMLDGDALSLGQYAAAPDPADLAAAPAPAASVLDSLSPKMRKQLEAGRPLVTEHGLLAPLVMYNQVVGLIGLQNPTTAGEPPRVWSSEEISTLQALSTQISLAIDNARLLEESQRRTSQIHLLQEVTAVAASQTNLVELLDNVAQKLRASLDLNACGVILFENGGSAGSDGSQPGLPTYGSLIAEVQANPRRLRTGLSLGGRLALADYPLLLQAAQSRHTLVFGQAQDLPDAGPLARLLRDRDSHTLILTPLLSRGEIMGLLSLELSDPQRQVSEDEQQLLDQVSLQLSSAIEVALSFQQAVQRAEQERLLSEVSNRMRQTLDLNTILKTAAEEIRQVLGVPEVTVSLERQVVLPDQPSTDSGRGALGGQYSAGEQHPAPGPTEPAS